MKTTLSIIALMCCAVFPTREGGDRTLFYEGPDGEGNTISVVVFVDSQPSGSVIITTTTTVRDNNGNVICGPEGDQDEVPAWAHDVQSEHRESDGKNDPCGAEIYVNCGPSHNMAELAWDEWTPQNVGWEKDNGTWPGVFNDDDDVDLPLVGEQ